MGEVSGTQYEIRVAPNCQNAKFISNNLPRVLCKVVDLLQQVFLGQFTEALDCLEAIHIVPDGEISTYVHSIIQQYVSSGSYSLFDLRPAATLPIEHNGKLLCNIVLEESELAGVTPDGGIDAPTLSTILEELLHVRLFLIMYKNGCTLHPTDDSSSLATSCYSEYAVSRWKSNILISGLLASPEGEPQAVHLSSGEPLGPTIDLARVRFYSIITDTFEGKISPDDAWSQLLSVLYRSLLEPLARESGYIAGDPEYNRDYGKASESQFYRESVAHYWQLIQKELDSSFMRELEDIESTIKVIADVINDFLGYIGVYYQRVDKNQLRIHFDPPLSGKWLGTQRLECP